jgi:hypothetical protein
MVDGDSRAVRDGGARAMIGGRADDRRQPGCGAGLPMPQTTSLEGSAARSSPARSGDADEPTGATPRHRRDAAPVYGASATRCGYCAPHRGDRTASVVWTDAVGVIDAASTRPPRNECVTAPTSRAPRAVAVRHGRMAPRPCCSSPALATLAA